MNHGPNITTHEPVKGVLPVEGNEALTGRPDIPPPSLWQTSVKAVRKLDGKECIVARLDYSTNMFRAYYPDEGDVDPNTGRHVGRYADRTEWEHCREWNVAVTFSPRELERQKAKQALDAEIATLDPKSLAAVSVLCDDTDPARALAKLEALRKLGVVNTSAAAAHEAVTELKAKR